MRISDWSSDVCSSDLLDDVGVRLQRQLAKLGQILRHALRFGEVFREQAKEACGDRNVAGLHIDAGGSGKRADDRQKRTRRKKWRLSRPCVNDGWQVGSAVGRESGGS